MMTAEIRKLIAARPFASFSIHGADGSARRVPTGDHVAMPPNGGRIFVFGDADDYEILSPLLVSRVSVGQGASSPASDR